MHKLDTFTTAYIECAVWSSTDDTGEPLDNLDLEIHPETVDQMVKDCQDFQAAAGELIDDNLSQAGHDFWLTRNGHGAGFWDGEWPEHGDTLTKLAKSFGPVELYVDDAYYISQM
jgi:hypothetical protein